MNKFITPEELVMELRRFWFKMNCEHGWFNPMFIDWQYDYEREEFDIF